MMLKDNSTACMLIYPRENSPPPHIIIFGTHESTDRLLLLLFLLASSMAAGVKGLMFADFRFSPDCVVESHSVTCNNNCYKKCCIKTSDSLSKLFNLNSRKTRHTNLFVMVFKNILS